MGFQLHSYSGGASSDWELARLKGPGGPLARGTRIIVFTAPAPTRAQPRALSLTVTAFIVAAATSRLSPNSSE